MAVLQAVIVVVMFSVTSQAGDPTLGKCYYLPDNDIMNPHIGGPQIFDDFDDRCFKWEILHQTTDDRSSYEDTNRFYRSISTDSSLSVKLTGAYTMGTTLNVKTKAMSSGSTEIKGTSLNVRTYVNVSYLEEDCFRSSRTRLKRDVVNMIDSMNSTIDKPWLPENWAKYKTFLKTYGSHFVIKTYLGAVVRQWTFSKATAQYTDHQLKVRACVDFAGTTEIGKLNVSSCSGVSQEEAEDSLRLEASNYLDIRGGSDQAREQFRITRSTEDLNKVLEEGRKIQSPVSYEYVAIWDILQEKFFDDPVRYAKAMNLMLYYHGYLDFGCGWLTASGYKLRQFRYTKDTTPDVPKFECVLIREGCQVDGDCNVGGGGTVTYCHGNSCFEYKDPKFGEKAKSVVTRTQQSGHYNQGVNTSCHYKAVPVGAYCRDDVFVEKVIWSGEEQIAAALAKAARYRAALERRTTPPTKQQKVEL